MNIFSHTNVLPLLIRGPGPHHILYLGGEKPDYVNIFHRPCETPANRRQFLAGHFRAMRLRQITTKRTILRRLKEIVF